MNRFHPSRCSSSRAAGILLATLALFGVATGMVLNYVRGPEWTASTNVLVQNSSGSVLSLLLTGQVIAVTSEDVSDAATLAVSQAVLTQAAQKLGGSQGWADLAKSVSAAPVPSSHLLTVTATAPDRAAALRASNVVASTLVLVAQQQLHLAVANLPQGATSSADVELERRGQLLTKTLQPMQAFSTAQPDQLLPSYRTPAAFGVVGFAAGALAILLLTIRRPTVRHPRDAQRLLELPAVAFNDRDGSSEALQVVRALFQGRPRGSLVICPVDSAAEKVVMKFADWAGKQLDASPAARTVLTAEPAIAASAKRLRPADSISRVLVSSTPAATVLGKRPTSGDLTGLLLVVRQGTPRQVVADAASLLAGWCPVDAVVVTG